MPDDQISPFRSTPVKADFVPDGGPGKHRIGLILLSNDYVTERDFINTRPGDEVALFCARVPNTPHCTVETLPKMAPHITAAAATIVPEGRLDVIAYSCTSGTVVMGYDAICARVHAARPGVPVVTPITASLAALEHLGARKLAVLTPYTDDVNGAIANHLESNGVDLRAFTSFRIQDNEVMAALPPEAIYEAALEADRPEADALFISCTAIRAVDVVGRIERALGKPVVTANQAMIWQALRWSGYTEVMEGCGRLLRLPG
ncbi:MAG TPA: Asp/Glu racemase [Pseudomonadales bacterium]